MNEMFILQTMGFMFFLKHLRRNVMTRFEIYERGGFYEVIAVSGNNLRRINSLGSVYIREHDLDLIKQMNDRGKFHFLAELFEKDYGS